jgi:hypothetical protein
VQATTDSNHRIWTHAIAAAAAMVVIPTVGATVGWFTGGSRNSDVNGVHELILLFVMLLIIPSAALTLGVLAPSAIALDRLTRGRTSRLTNMLLGALLSVPALSVLLVAVSLLSSGTNLRKFETRVMHAISIGVNHPGRVLFAIGFFAVPGVIVALGMRHRRRVNPVARIVRTVDVSYGPPPRSRRRSDPDPSP